jgi:predicted phage terminase large subunit-like protein
MTKDKNNEVYLLDVKRWQVPPSLVEARILQTAVEDHARTDVKQVDTWMEEEAGASGKSLIDHYARDIMQGFYFRGDKPSGSKEIRAAPYASYAANGHVWLINGVWLNDYLNEVEAFPYSKHDDQVDGSSGAFEKLFKYGGGLDVVTARRPR